ncbi:hypothetical protein H4219_006088, partial [Mycoemilia scoparia]
NNQGNSSSTGPEPNVQGSEQDVQESEPNVQESEQDVQGSEQNVQGSEQNVQESEQNGHGLGRLMPQEQYKSQPPQVIGEPSDPEKLDFLVCVDGDGDSDCDVCSISKRDCVCIGGGDGLEKGSNPSNVQIPHVEGKTPTGSSLPDQQVNGNSTFNIDDIFHRQENNITESPTTVDEESSDVPLSTTPNGQGRVDNKNSDNKGEGGLNVAGKSSWDKITRFFSKSTTNSKEDQDNSRFKEIASKIFPCVNRTKKSQKQKSDSATNSNNGSTGGRRTLSQLEISENLKKHFLSIIMIIQTLFGAVALIGSAKVIDKGYQQNLDSTNIMILQNCMYWAFLLFIPCYCILNENKYRAYKEENKTKSQKCLATTAKVHMDNREIASILQFLLSVLILNSWPLYQVREGYSDSEYYANNIMFVHVLVSFLVYVGVHYSSWQSKKKHKESKKRQKGKGKAQ